MMSKVVRMMWLVVLATICCLAVGCGDDDCPTTPEVSGDEPIAQFTMASIGSGTADIIESQRFTLGYDRACTDSIGTIVVVNQDRGLTRMLDAETCPNFDAFCASLTNGTNEPIYLMDWSLPSGLSGLIGRSEENLLQGGLSGDMSPDLAGAEITRILMTVQFVYLNVPGEDPNGDGVWTEVYYSLHFLVYGAR